MIYALALTGPTASGKTALSLSLAEHLCAEIISADSMQIYRGMDIGTAKATEEEQRAVRHHLINITDPRENYSAFHYRADAILAAKDIESRGKMPLFVGGTGLYIDALMRAGADNSPESDPQYRERVLSSIKNDEDIADLWQRLNSVDPESANKIHKNNVKRVVRALEIYDKTGVPKSEFDRQTREDSSEIKIEMITLDFYNRENLYNRVNLRVEEMIKMGLLREVEALYREGMLPPDSTAAQAIGYKELILHIEGKCSLSQSIEEIKLSSRRYAKRQLTWFRHVKDARRIYVDRADGTMKSREELICEVLSAADELITKRRTDL